MAALPFAVGVLGVGLATGIQLSLFFGRTYYFGNPHPWGLPWRFALIAAVITMVVALVVQPRVPKPHLFGSLGTAIVAISMAGAIWLGLVLGVREPMAILGVMGFAISISIALIVSGVALYRKPTGSTLTH